MAKENVKEALANAGKFAVDTAVKAKDSVDKAQETIVKAMDVNGNGEIDIEDVIILGLRTPGVKINRANFLRAEFSKNYPTEVINNAIMYTPARAGISLEDVNKIADAVIQYERIHVSGIAAALGTPGGMAMVATVPADIAQYYGYMLRATQKLLYLYGFPEIDTTENGQKLDSETLNILIICLGVMYGVSGANKALKAMTQALAKGIEKKIFKTALTKGTLFPIVKRITSWFGINLTKKVLTGFVNKTLPVVGGVVGGGLTYMSFKPCCDKLKASLQDTMLSNPNYQPPTDEEIIDIECDLNE